jgi:peptidoglycan/LPS O-acetylase OafA/YrhL
VSGSACTRMIRHCGMFTREPGCAIRLASRPDLRGHMPALDWVRGLAILMVLLHYFIGNMLPISSLERAIVGVTNYGSHGVELFFVLSGFLITGILYDRESSRQPRRGSRP